MDENRTGELSSTDDAPEEERGFAALMRQVASGQWWRRLGPRSAYGVARTTKHVQRGSRGVGVKDHGRLAKHFAQMEVIQQRINENWRAQKGAVVSKRLRASRTVAARGRKRLVAE